MADDIIIKCARHGDKILETSGQKIARYLYPSHNCSHPPSSLPSVSGDGGSVYVVCI